MPEEKFYQGPIYRLLTALFGVFLCGCGIFVFLQHDLTLLIRIGAGLVLFLLGASAIWSAYQSKEPWMSKLGPLPF